MNINMKTAVQTAAAFLTEMFPEIVDVRLEEVQVSDSGPWWDVVLSYLPSSYSAMLVNEPKRIFKLVEIDYDTGEPHALKMWKF
jgi:hypothetical protein